VTLKVEGNRVRITHLICLIGIFVVVLCERNTKSQPAPGPCQHGPLFYTIKKGSGANSGRLENGLQTDLASGTLSGGEEIKWDRGNKRWGEWGWVFYGYCVHYGGRGKHGASRGCKLYIARDVVCYVRNKTKKSFSSSENATKIHFFLTVMKRAK